jgi:hypothetical protein
MPKRRRSCLTYSPPFNPVEEAYLDWLACPGDDLGLFLGVGPTVEQRIARARADEHPRRANRRKKR